MNKAGSRLRGSMPIIFRRRRTEKQIAFPDGDMDIKEGDTVVMVLEYLSLADDQWWLDMRDTTWSDM